MRAPQKTIEAGFLRHLAGGYWGEDYIPVLLEDAGKGYCHALIPEPLSPFPERLSKPSTMHGVEARAQEILGLGVWGKGVQRLGALNTPVFFYFLFGAPNGASFADRHRPVSGTMKLPLEGSSSPIHRRIANSRLPPIQTSLPSLDSSKYRA